MDTKLLLRHAQFHGAKRLLDSRHRLYWVVTLVLLLWCALANLYSTVIRFLEAPTAFVTTDSFSTKIRFPAVLVCPEVRYPDHKIDHFLQHAQYPENMTADTIRPIIRQLGAFFSPDAPYNLDDLTTVQEFLEYNEMGIEQAGIALTSTCNETLFRCRFGREDYKCLDLFHMEITLYGLCCVFNGKSIKGELNGRRRPRRLKNRTDWYTTEVGPFASLIMAINQTQPMDNVDLSYKWLVTQSHSWYVDMAKNGTPVSPGSETWSSFLVRYLHISDDSLFMSESLRGCWMEDRKLQYFSTYNKENCLLECGMHKLIRQCDCVLPVYYRPPGVPLCDATTYGCAKKVLEQFDKSSCDCKIPCEYQQEFSETTTYEFSSMARPIDSFYDGLDLKTVSVVRVYIKSHETFSYIRRPLFNFYDLFSQLGGVFSVFFGCSILSIVELLQLAWYTFRASSEARKIKRLALETTKKKNVKKSKLLLFGSSRSRSGRVGKISEAKRKVKFFKRKISNDLPWLQ